MNRTHNLTNRWPMLFRALTRWTAWGALSTTLFSCGESPYAIIHSHLVTDAPEVPLTYSCSQLGNGGGSSRGEDDGFWVRELETSDGVVITWGEGRETLGRRDFDVEFFSSHRMDRFIIETTDGQELSYMVWGADRCTRCPEQSFTPLPGDSLGCGSLNDGGTPSPVDDPAVKGE